MNHSISSLRIHNWEKLKIILFDRGGIAVIASRITWEQKTEIMGLIQNFFEEERSETIGNLAAEQLLDFICKQIGPHIYNIAVFDARRLINDRLGQIDEDLFTLERPTKRN